MGLQWRDKDSEARLSASVDPLSGCLGHADRVGPFRSYCTGLPLPGERKSVAPMVGLPVAWRLDLPESCADHRKLRRKVEVPGRLAFKTKPQIALSETERALVEGIAPAVAASEGRKPRRRRFDPQAGKPPSGWS